MARGLCRLGFAFLVGLWAAFFALSGAFADGQSPSRSGVLPLDRALSPPHFAGVRVGTIELPEPGELSAGEQDVVVTNDFVPDTADLYTPLIAEKQRARYEGAFPVVVVLQGANVDKEQYSILGARLAQLGFISVIPNSFRTFPPPFGSVLFSDVQVVPRAIAAVERQASDPDSPIYGIADTDTVGVVGHSLGGSAALYAAAAVCVGGLCEGCPNPPFGQPGEVCPELFARPDALKAVAVYGTNLVVPSPPAPPPPPYIVTPLPYDGSIPIAFLSGSVDGISTPEETEATYHTVPPVKSLISTIGTNHFGITDENNPVPPLQADNIEPELPQRRGARRIAETIALWLRWHLIDDPLAADWFTSMGTSLDGTVVLDVLDLIAPDLD
jgi:hypothetical protein